MINQERQDTAYKRGAILECLKVLALEIYGFNINLVNSMCQTIDDQITIDMATVRLIMRLGS